MTTEPWDLPDFRHDVLQCPHCGAYIDASLAVSGEKAPQPGDVTICMTCAAPAMYGEGLRLRKPTPREYVAISQHPDFQRAMLALMTALSNGEGPDD